MLSSYKSYTILGCKIERTLPCPETRFHRTRTLKHLQLSTLHRTLIANTFFRRNTAHSGEPAAGEPAEGIHPLLREEQDRTQLPSPGLYILLNLWSISYPEIWILQNISNMYSKILPKMALIIPVSSGNKYQKIARQDKHSCHSFIKNTAELQRTIMMLKAEKAKPERNLNFLLLFLVRDIHYFLPPTTKSYSQNLNAVIHLL